MVGSIDDLFSHRIVDRPDREGDFLLRIDQPDFWKLVDLKAFSLVEDPHYTWITELNNDAKEQAFAQVEDHLMNEDSAFYLTINGVGQAVGYAIGTVSQGQSPLEGPKFEILDLYTHNPFRGRKFSVHTAAKMIEHAGNAGFHEVSAVIPKGKEAAIHLYEKMGFERVGDVTKERFIQQDGELVPGEPIVLGHLYMKRLDKTPYASPAKQVH
ncbi:GNAT family N-acetyltransferase [Candidatus Woesearchaeota archaeon]|nr:GNAT family N-acetyltransferase [Candidatus Woesearchaeota archaeon]